MINIFKGNAQQSVAFDELVYLETAAGAAVTGATLTITLSKAAGVPAAITPTVTEHGGGYYKIAFTGVHFNTLGRATVEVSAATALTLSLQYTVIDSIFTAADVATLAAIYNDVHEIYRERCGRHSLNLATGVESVTLGYDEITRTRTLCSDANLTVPVTSATDPVLSMDYLV